MSQREVTQVVHGRIGIWDSNVLLQSSSSCIFHDTGLEIQKEKGLAFKSQTEIIQANYTGHKLGHECNYS